jgi:hypothetical protein
MKTQICVDWLAEQLRKYYNDEVNEIGEDHITDGMKHLLKHMDKKLKTARKMHREEVVNSFTKGQLDIIEVIMPIPDEIKVDTKDGENYYTQTFVMGNRKTTPERPSYGKPTINYFFLFIRSSN